MLEKMEICYGKSDLVTYAYKALTGAPEWVSRLWVRVLLLVGADAFGYLADQCDGDSAGLSEWINGSPAPPWLHWSAHQLAGAGYYLEAASHLSHVPAHGPIPYIPAAIGCLLWGAQLADPDPAVQRADNPAHAARVKAEAIIRLALEEARLVPKEAIE